MSDAIVRENSLHFNGRNYFRVSSQDTSLGAVGEKKMPVLKGNFLDVKDRIKAQKLKIRDVGLVSIDSERTSKRDFLANISLAKVFKVGSVDTAYEDVRSNKLRLLYMSVDCNDMVDAINRSPAIREDLKRWGNDARVVTSCFVIVTAETGKQFSSSTNVEAEINVDGVTVSPKLSLSSGGSTEVKFPVGACLAYGLSSIEWDNKNEKKAEKAVDLRPDDFGL
jgi:hypothetical protein